MDAPFESVNVLEADAIRSGMKEYSAWPTFPQVGGGGSEVQRPAHAVEFPARRGLAGASRLLYPAGAASGDARLLTLRPHHPRRSTSTASSTAAATS
jgi:hypothetical protein